MRGHPSPPLRWPGGAAPGVASLPPGGQAESPLSSVKEAGAAGQPPGRQRGPAEGTRVASRSLSACGAFVPVEQTSFL